MIARFQVLRPSTHRIHRWNVNEEIHVTPSQGLYGREPQVFHLERIGEAESENLVVLRVDRHRTEDLLDTIVDIPLDVGDFRFRVHIPDSILQRLQTRVGLLTKDVSIKWAAYSERQER